MSDGDGDGGLDMFDEPADYYQPEKEPTFVEYRLRDGKIISLRLVGYNPLWVGTDSPFYTVLCTIPRASFSRCFASASQTLLVSSTLSKTPSNG